MTGVGLKWCEVAAPAECNLLYGPASGDNGAEAEAMADDPLMIARRSTTNHQSRVLREIHSKRTLGNPTFKKVLEV
jgi:hypothetical protein